MDDYQILCAKCALFGPHQGHQFIEIGEVVKEIAQRAKKVFDGYTIFEDLENNQLQTK